MMTMGVRQLHLTEEQRAFRTEIVTLLGADPALVPEHSIEIDARDRPDEVLVYFDTQHRGERVSVRGRIPAHQFEEILTRHPRAWRVEG